MILRYLLYAIGVITAAALSYRVSAAELKIGGTGGDLGTMQQLGMAFEAANSGIAVTVVPSLGSGGGIRAVTAGAIDIAIISRPLKNDERAKGISDFPYAETAMAIVTSGHQTIKNLTSESLVAIYATGAARWPNGELIRVVLRPSSDGDYILMTDAIAGMQEAFKAAEDRKSPLGISDQDAAMLLAANPDAIGYLSLSLIKGEGRMLNIIPLDGVTPSPETLGDGTYNLKKTFFMATKTEASESVRAFIAFMKSEKGAEILTKTGHIPVR